MTVFRPRIIVFSSVRTSFSVSLTSWCERRRSLLAGTSFALSSTSFSLSFASGAAPSASAPAAAAARRARRASSTSLSTWFGPAASSSVSRFLSSSPCLTIGM